MRKFLIAGLGLVLGGAAMLIPAGGAADVPANTPFSGRINNLSTVNLTIVCPTGATYGSARGDNTIAVVSGGSGNTGSGTPPPKTIDATVAGGSGTQTFTTIPESQSLTLQFPCSGSTSRTVTFQPKRANGNTVGTASTVTVNLTRVAS